MSRLVLFRKQPPYAEFEDVALPHLDELYRSARRMVGDRSSAEDVVQETYLRAWRSFARFQKGSNCRAWLFKILVNCANDFHRRSSAEPVADDSDRILDEQVARRPVASGITDPEMIEALQGVPHLLREVLILADVEEFTYREIAEMVDVPIGTVMSRLSRARGRLRRLLSEPAKTRRSVVAGEGKRGA